MLILEIAAGIVLAVVVLAFWQFIAVVAVVLIAICAVLVALFLAYGLLWQPMAYENKVAAVYLCTAVPFFIFTVYHLVNFLNWLRKRQGWSK